jgi:hypothetical protein
MVSSYDTKYLLAMFALYPTLNFLFLVCGKYHISVFYSIHRMFQDLKVNSAGGNFEPVIRETASSAVEFVL